MGYVPFEGNLNKNGFPTGNFGKKYKIHLPKKYSNKPVEAVVVPVPFTEFPLIQILEKSNLK